MADRQDNARITAELQNRDGTWRALGFFEKRTGGDSDSAAVVYNMGSIGKPRRALGGRPEPQGVTIERLYDDEAQALDGFLRGRVGNGNMRINEQPLNDEEEILPHSTTWTGKLKKVGVSDRDMEGNSASMLQIEMLVETIA